MFGVAVVTMLAVLVLAAVVVSFAFGPVARARVERLARRESLLITVDNGPIVIRYLATTRRWRGGCLLLGIVGFALYSVQRGNGLRIDFLPAFLSWFVGALIAEWRISTAAAGTRRLASLHPRRIGNYVSAGSRWLAAVVAVLGFGIALAGIVEFARSGRGIAWPLIGWLVVAVAVVPAILMVARHVLTRPQRLAGPDIVAADDAIRSRSLHAIVGSAVALGGYLLSAVLSYLSMHHINWFTGRVLSPVSAIGLLLLPLLGLVIATATSKPRARHDVVSAGAS